MQKIHFLSNCLCVAGPSGRDLIRYDAGITLGAAGAVGLGGQTTGEGRS